MAKEQFLGEAVLLGNDLKKRRDSLAKMRNRKSEKRNKGDKREDRFRDGRSDGEKSERDKRARMFAYKEILTSFKKGLRNGNWRKLSRLEKALYMASLWYSRVQGAIINEMLVSKLSTLMEKLKETKGARIFKRGFEKAVELLNKGEGIFAWAPSLKEWLKDADYVFWLGAGGLRIDTGGGYH